MNIIYKLVNKSKIDNPRLYIGSKLECDIVLIDNIRTIVSLRDHKVYLGSSSSPIMREDLSLGNIFEAEVLEVVKDPTKIRFTEQSWLERLDAASSEEFYNLTNNALNGKSNQYSIINDLGELQKDIAKSRSSMSKRNKTARLLGFEHCYDLYLHIWKHLQNGLTFAQIADGLGCERHYPSRWLREINLEKLAGETPSYHVEDVAKLFYKGYSYEAISSILDITKPTVDKAIQYYNFQNMTLQYKLMLNSENIGREIALRVLSEEDIPTISKSMGIDHRTGYKYFYNFLRKRLKPSDLE